MPTTYGTVITTAGAGIIADCILNGNKLRISRAAAGDGGGAYYQPTVDQSGLKNETWRGDIAAAELNPTSPNMIDVKIIIGDDVGGFTIREMAIYSEDGVAIAICNTPDTEKVALSGGVSGKLTMIMHIVVADASVMEFTINPVLDTVSREELREAVSQHDLSDASHFDIRQLALNSVQKGEVYTKEESDTRCGEAVRVHNEDENVHASLQTRLANLESRVQVLELKYATNITQNPFNVNFSSLAGLEVAGVWNEAFERIEF